MKTVRYSKYVPGLLEGIASEDLLQALGDFLLASGFSSPMGEWWEMPPESGSPGTLDALLAAIRQALEDSGLLDEEQRRALAAASAEQLRALVRALAERLEQEGWIGTDARAETSEPGAGRAEAPAAPPARFEITDKTLDFLGFKTLKDLFAGLGRADFGRHDTREFAAGVEASGASRPYEFGETLNLDVPATIGRALRREGLPAAADARGAFLTLDYPDLMVHQSEYQSSCATVLLLDCSHSMILYGEDRFTPAKRVALALAHLIRTQYPGDSLALALFHDSAEEVPLSQLARVRVGPYHTNTREGLRLARRLLARERKDMRQIVMITDGKPSALTLEDGRIYKNAFGLDPLVVGRTLEEVAKCRRAGILINTFMLASDYGLVQFVQKITAICRGKAYFTTPYTLGQYLLLDYMNRKSRTIH